MRGKLSQTAKCGLQNFLLPGMHDDPLVFGGVPPGAQSVKSIVLTNYKSTPVKVKTHVEGQLKDWTTTPSDFTLAGDETSRIEVTVNVPPGTAYGNYTGTFVFEFYN